MPAHHVERTLPYTPEQLFRLVGDVARYPDFVPWVTSMRAEPPQPDGEGVDRLEAEAGVGFSFLTERFTTWVRRDAGACAIEVGLVRGPFKRLSNRWRFEPHPRGARAVFDIDFQFRTRMLDLVLAANFDRAVNKLIGCFEARAAALYGRASAPQNDLALSAHPREGGDLDTEREVEASGLALSPASGSPPSRE